MVIESVLLERVWGPHADKRSLERRLDVHIKRGKPSCSRP
jgi:hypothetical protein